MIKKYKDTFQYVSFCMYSKQLIPDEITKKLRIKPDLVCARGYWKCKDGKKIFRPYGQWNLDSHLRGSNVYVKIENLLGILMQKKQILKTLLKKHRGEIHVTVHPNPQISLFNLEFKPEILKMCGELGIDLLISIWKWEGVFEP